MEKNFKNKGNPTGTFQSKIHDSREKTPKRTWKLIITPNIEFQFLLLNMESLQKRKRMSNTIMLVYKIYCIKVVKIIKCLSCGKRVFFFKSVIRETANLILSFTGISVILNIQQWNYTFVSLNFQWKLKEYCPPSSQLDILSFFLYIYLYVGSVYIRKQV